MSAAPLAFAVPADRRALVAIDLGAESCRVSLLRWVGGHAHIEMVHRFANAPINLGGSIHWDLQAICGGVEDGLRQCAEIASERIASIGVDGWGVDYVRLAPDGNPVHRPYCYRDLRTIPAFETIHQRISIERLYALTGVQPLPINTLYQLYADKNEGVPGNAPWISLPEYILHWLGAERFAEYTNATHTGLVDLQTKNWSKEIFDAAELDMDAAPRIVSPGTEIGKLHGSLAEFSAFRNTRLIATACHDTASAIAGISAAPEDWAYISSGTWSLVGALIDKPCNTEEAREKGFTNLGAVGNEICFHKIVNGMWIVRQCIEYWGREGESWTVQELIERAERCAVPKEMLDLEDADLLLPGNMPERINAQRERLSLERIAESAGNAPQFASLIFHSLARTYAQVVLDLKRITGKNPQRIYVVGGGSRNYLLNRLTERATGITVLCGDVESSTVGNLRLQLGICNAQGKKCQASRCSQFD